MRNKDFDKKFLPHLSDPLRKKIGVDCVRHQYAKFFQSNTSDDSFKKIDEVIQNRYNDLSVSSFWNEVHAVSMGFMQTNFVFWDTSLNVDWSEKNCPIDTLWSGRSYGGINATGKITDIKEKIFLESNHEFLKKTQEEMREKFSSISSDEQFPIFVVRKEGELKVVDGNTRLLNAIVNKKETIKAYIGEPSVLSDKPIFYEHWIPTPLLLDLVYLYKWQYKEGQGRTRKLAETISDIIRNSGAGKIEFFEGVIDKNNEIHRRLSEEVLKILE
jgi:hypothetical protein